jgi:hypothetical protein
MTFNKAPWAIDGARSTSALARLATYATGGGRSGIVRPADLKVSALAVPGNGLLISRGSAIVLNGYQTNPNEVYAVSNPATHTVLSASMPAAIPSVGYYLVCVVIGDPEFSQVGHPFMPSSLSEEDAADFEYVRPVIIPCSSSTTTFEQLNKSYPGFALARLEIPANTSTITNAMIVDLRQMSQPRSERKVFAQTFTDAYSLNYDDDEGSFHDWTPFKPTVIVPPWATKVTIVATMAGVLAWNTGSTNGYLRVTIANAGGPGVPYDEDPPPGGYSGGSKSTLVASGTIDVTGIAGQAVGVTLQGSRDTGEPGYLTTWGGSQLILDVQFDEGTI